MIKIPENIQAMCKEHQPDDRYMQRYKNKDKKYYDQSDFLFMCRHAYDYSVNDIVRLINDELKAVGLLSYYRMTWCKYNRYEYGVSRVPPFIFYILCKIYKVAPYTILKDSKELQKTVQNKYYSTRIKKLYLADLQDNIIE